MNKTKEGLGHQEIVKEKVNDFKEDISDTDFNPKSVSSPKVKDICFVLKVKKDQVKKDEIKVLEHFFACSKCYHKSKRKLF